MFFDEREGPAPYSAEVDHFLHVMAQARIMSEPNPSFELLHFDRAQKRTIMRLNEKRLQELRPILEQLGDQLAASVTMTA